MHGFCFKTGHYLVVTVVIQRCAPSRTNWQLTGQHFLIKLPTLKQPVSWINRKL